MGNRYSYGTFDILQKPVLVLPLEFAIPGTFGLFAIPSTPRPTDSVICVYNVRGAHIFEISLFNVNSVVKC